VTYEFTFEFIGDDEASTKALTSLYRWFREDLAAADGAKVELAANAEPDGMGAADVLCMALTQLTAIGGLAVAFASWRDARSSAPPVRIRFGEATLELTNASAEQLAAALHALATTGESTSADPDDPAPSAATPEA